MSSIAPTDDMSVKRWQSTYEAWRSGKLSILGPDYAVEASGSIADFLTHGNGYLLNAAYTKFTSEHAFEESEFMIGSGVAYDQVNMMLTNRRLWLGKQGAHDFTIIELDQIQEIETVRRLMSFDMTVRFVDGAILTLKGIACCPMDDAIIVARFLAINGRSPTAKEMEILVKNDSIRTVRPASILQLLLGFNEYNGVILCYLILLCSVSAVASIFLELSDFELLYPDHAYKRAMLCAALTLGGSYAAILCTRPMGCLLATAPAVGAVFGLAMLIPRQRLATFGIVEIASYQESWNFLLGFLSTYVLVVIGSAFIGMFSRRDT